MEKKTETPKPKAVKEATPEPSQKRSARATARYLRISPRKVRLVINTIRYQPAHHAASILTGLIQRSARLTEKVLKSAVANAKVLKLDESRLIVSDIRADGGPTMKRFISRSMGRADTILKRTTHLSLVLTEGEKQWKDMPTPSEENEAAARPAAS